MRGDGGGGFRCQRQRTAKRVVGHHDFSRVHPGGGKPGSPAYGFDDAAAQQLSERRDRIARPGRRVLQRPDGVQQIAKLGCFRREHLTERVGIRHHLSRDLFVPLLQLAKPREHDRLVGRGGRRREVEEPVGDARQRRHHDDRAAIGLRGRDVPHQPADRLGVAD